jgi:hypothetical protein
MVGHFSYTVPVSDNGCINMASVIESRLAWYHKFSAEAQQAFVALMNNSNGMQAMMNQSCLSTVFIHDTGDEAGVWLDARRQRSKAGGNQRQPYPAEPDGSYQPDSAG